MVNKLKKYRFYSLMMVCALFLLNINSFAQPINQLIAHLTSYKVFLNGEEQSFENPVVNIDGKLYVPLNEFAGKLDMKVKGNKIEQKVNLTSKGDDILISVYLCPSDTSGVVYRMDLFNDGRLSTTVGVGEIPIEAIENLDKDMLPAVSPKVTRYKNLSGSTMKKITNLTSKITVDEKKDESCVEGGGFYALVSFQGKFHRCVYESDKRWWQGSDHMFEIVKTLIKNSPVEVIRFDYEDEEEYEYYTNVHQW